MKSGMWNNFILRFGLLRIFGVIILVLGLIGGGIAYASGVLVTKNIAGTGTITVNPPASTPATYNFTVTNSTLDFSGSVNSGAVYTKTVQINVGNNGTNGTTESATINSISVSSPDLLSGWTISGSSGTIAVGASEPLNITLTSPALTGTVVLPNFTITLTAS